MLSYVCNESLLQRHPGLSKYTDSDGKEKFKGFTVELLDRVGAMANFDYTIEVTPDGSYGVLDAATGTWNGMIGEVVSEVILHDDVYIC